MTDESLIVGKVLVSTYSGVDLITTPLTFQARQMLQRAAEAKYPAPDKTLYERKSELKEFGSDDFATIPAENNPEYLAEAERIESLCTRFVNDAALAVSVTHPEQDVLVKAYAKELTAMRDVSSDEVPDNDWAAVVRLFLASEPELLQIYGVISRHLPLTPGEVAEGFAYFRVHLRRPTAVRGAGGKSAPDSESAEQVSA